MHVAVPKYFSSVLIYNYKFFSNFFLISTVLAFLSACGMPSHGLVCHATSLAATMSLNLRSALNDCSAVLIHMKNAHTLPNGFFRVFSMKQS